MNEISYLDNRGRSGLFVSYTIADTVNQYWDGFAFVPFNPLNWDDYFVDLADMGGGVYMADFPATIGGGAYYITFYELASASATTATAQLSETTQFNWDGTREISLYDGPAVEFMGPGGVGPITARQGLGMVFDAAVFGILSNIGSANPIEVRSPSGDLVRAKVTVDPIGNRLVVEFVNLP